MDDSLEEKKTIPIEDYGFPVTLAFSKDGRMFFSERVTGRLWEVDPNFYDTSQQTPQKARLITTFDVVPLVGHHETGLLGITLDHDFATNHYIYCYYTFGKSADKFWNRVVRIRDDGSDEKILLDNIPAGVIHNGGIMSFGPDNKLYIGVGVNNFEKEKSQDLKFWGGKVLRINPDGSFPDDNPFPNSPVFSYGHRNVFCMAFHPKTGKLYISDVGPDHDDEINIIQKGGNYGWPEVMGFSDNPKFINPIISYTPVITPTQGVFVGDNLYFTSYNEGTVHKLILSGKNFDKVDKDEIVYKGDPFTFIGVFYGPDKNFYLTTSQSIQRINLA